MSCEVIDRVHALAHTDPFGLELYNRNHQPMVDNDAEQNDESYNPDSDESNESDDDNYDDFYADYSVSDSDDDDCGDNGNGASDDNYDNSSRDDDANDNGYNTPAVAGEDKIDTALVPDGNAGANKTPPDHAEDGVTPETPGVDIADQYTNDGDPLLNPLEIAGVNDTGSVIETDSLDYDDIAIKETTTGTKMSIDSDPIRISEIWSDWTWSYDYTYGPSIEHIKIPALNKMKFVLNGQPVKV